MSTQTTSQGKVVQVIGPVVDVEFDGGELPEINTALRSPTRRSTTGRTT